MHKSDCNTVGSVTGGAGGATGEQLLPNKVIGGASYTSCSPNFSVGLLFSNIVDDITYIAVIL